MENIIYIREREQELESYKACPHLADRGICLKYTIECSIITRQWGSCDLRFKKGPLKME